MSNDAPPTQKLSSPALKEPSSYSILCVDDEINILSSLKRMFGLVGYKVTTAESGAAGLQTLEKSTFDVIISDMRMPNMDGAKFFESVRAQWPDTIRILLTGYSDASSAIAAVNQGEIYRYLTKPWVDDELLATVKGALEFIELKREREQLLELTRKHNTELEEKVKERTEHLSQANTKLRTSYISSIKAFSNLLDLRQPNLLVHSRKVAFLSMQMAKLAEFDEKQVQEVFIAGLLHDIGKIGMSDRVLRTNIADLPVSDFELYKSHTTLGSTCLAALDDMSDVAAMIRSHHERFDGKGFPDGLIGDKIPMGARILGVVETYEELMNGDVTKAPQSKEKALGIISSLSGKYFCPEVTKLFFKALGAQSDPSITNSLSSTSNLPKSKAPGPTKKGNTSSTQATPSDKGDEVVVDAQTLALSSSEPHSTVPASAPKKAASKVGADLPSGPTYKEFEAIIKKYPNSVVKDLRDEPNGFLWVHEGMKRYNEDDKLGEWLKNNKFVWSENESAWYFPII